MVFWGAALDLPTVVIHKESFERPPPEAKSTGQNSLMKSSFSALWQKKTKKKTMRAHVAGRRRIHRSTPDNDFVCRIAKLHNWTFTASLLSQIMILYEVFFARRGLFRSMNDVQPALQYAPRHRIGWQICCEYCDGSFHTVLTFHYDGCS